MSNRLDPATVHKIKQHLARGTRTAEIARQTEVSKSTIRKIELGHYGATAEANARPVGRFTGAEPIGKARRYFDANGPYAWCADCGANVKPPCHACAVRQIKRLEKEAAKMERQARQRRELAEALRTGQAAA